jgi:hypothetical protein
MRRQQECAAKDQQAETLKETFHMPSELRRRMLQSQSDY